MTDFTAWIPPAGEVVDPPVHPETVINVIYSDGQYTRCSAPASAFNWSASGDGPRVVGYAVVEEYKPAPDLREWWVHEETAKPVVHYQSVRAHVENGWTLVREVPDASREVVAWALVDSTAGGRMNFWDEETAHELQRRYGGTVVKLTGVKP
jgi:hypothetical protein